MNGSRIRNWRSVCLTSEPISSAWLHMAKLTLYLISFPRMPLLSISWGRRDNSRWLLPQPCCLVNLALSSLLSVKVIILLCFHPFLPSSLKFLVLPLILSFQYCIFVYHSHLPFLKQVLPLNAFFQKGQGIMFLAFIVTSVKVVIIWGCNPHPKCCL